MSLPSDAAGGGEIDAERVYLALRSRHVLALSRLDGTILWTSQDPVAGSWPPILAGNSLLLLSADAIALLDPATGRTERRLALSDEPTGPVTPAGPLLLVPVAPDRLIAVRQSDGQTAWTAGLGAASRVRAAISPDGGTAYLSLDGGRVCALRLDTGQRLWTEMLGGTLGPPVTARDRVIVGSDDNTVYARVAANGRDAWRWTTGGDIVGIASAGETVYVVSLDNTVRALNRGSGTQRWLTSLVTRAVAPPRLVGGQVLVAGVGPVLAGFDARTGTAGATFTLTGDLETAVLDGAPIVAAHSDGAIGAGVILVMRDGRVLGLRSGPEAGKDQ